MSSSLSDQRKLLALRDPKLASANLIAFIVAACGGGGGGSSSTPIIPSNNAPSAGADVTVTFSEDVNAGPLNLSAPTDSDGDTLTISVTGIPTSGTLNKADGTLIASGDSLTSAELQGLTFTPDANANDSTTSFGTFDYSVSDSNGGTDTRTVTISVDAVNDIPETEIVVTELAPKENTTSLTTFTATDIDGDALIYSISGGTDKDLFQIDASTGVLSFIVAPDYENPQDVDADNVYDVEVSATDPSGASVSLSYVITVNNVSEPETISGTVVDGLVSGATVNLMDAEGNVVASTTTNAQGQYNLEANENNGVRVVVDGGIDTSTGAPLSITLTASKNSKFVSAISTIIYQSDETEATLKEKLGLPSEFDVTNDNPLETVSVQKVNAKLINIISIGEALLQGSGFTDNTGDENIVSEIVQALRDEKDLFSVEGIKEVFTKSVSNTTSADRVSELVDSVAASIKSSNDAVDDSLNLQDIFQVQTVTLFGDTGILEEVLGVASETLTSFVVKTKSEILTLASAIDVGQPSFTSNASVSINENSTDVLTVLASNKDLDTITYSLEDSLDGSLFTIDSSTGELKFTTAPDFETPEDSNKDNAYSLVVVAKTANELQATQTVTVSVKDVNETVSGVLIDGYIAGATVFQDLDNDGFLDAGEPFTTTDATGAFTLTLKSPSPNAPIKVINTGFDTAANDLLRAVLEISATTSGSYILTPLSTLHSRLLSLDSSLYKVDAEKLVADLFGVTLSNVPNSSLFGYDPIVTMLGSGTEASQAQTVYSANQLLMTLGHLSAALGEYMGPKALANVQSAIQTLLDNASVSATASLSWGDTTELKSQSHDALMSALALYLKENKSATITDFLSDSTALTDILAKTLVNIQDYLTTVSYTHLTLPTILRV